MFKLALEGGVISEESIGIYLEVIVTYFQVLSQPLSGRTGENIEKMSVKSLLRLRAASGSSLIQL